MSNIEQDLIEQLGSIKRSLRIQAIVRLSRVGNSEAALKSLAPLVSKGDREESFFASQAIAKISQKLGKNLDSPIDSDNQQSAHAQPLEKRNFSAKDFLVATRSEAPTLLQYVRTKSNEISDDLLPSVGVFLGKFGDRSDAPFIQNYLKQHSDNMTLPYIGAAERIDIAILIPVLPYLLASSESLVRSRAVMALQKIDPIEAQRHFLHLLSSSKAENRLAAIEISFLFPFQKVKDYIIALLSEEQDPDVFKACTTILASNPSQEIALKILDILESTAPEQRKRGTVVFNIIATAIASAKILPAKDATPQALVSTWKQQRLQNFLNDLEIQLCTSTGAKREAMISWIEKNRSIPKVADFIERLALNPQTEDVYQLLTNSNTSSPMVLPTLDNLIGEKNSGEIPDKTIKSEQTNKKETNLDREQQSSYALPELTEEKETAEISPSESDSNSEKAQIQYLKDLELNQFFNEKSRITELAESSMTPVDLRVEALNTILRLTPGPKLKNLGIKTLAENDIKLKITGFKILERVAPEVLKEQLSDLLLAKDSSVRVRAVRFGLKIDQKNSIEALEKLISSKDQNSRSSAVSCLALCPFESVYHILIMALKGETHPLIAKQITDIFLNNPNPVILSMLDKIIIVNKNPALEMILSKARNELEELLSSIPPNLAKSNIKEVDLFAKNLSESKPYSVENVRKLTKATKKAEDKNQITDFLSKIKNMILENQFVALLGLSVFIVTVGLIYAFTNPNKGFNIEKYKQENRAVERNKPSKSKIPGTFRMNKPCTISGTVVNILSKTSLVIKHNGREIMVKFKNKEAENLKINDQVSVTCVPYRENPNGIILSTGQKISKINETSK